MKKTKQFYNYLIYKLKSTNEHGVHSPFVFDLVTNVIYNNTAYYSYKKVENFREHLLSSEKAAELIHRQNEAKYSQLLFRLVNCFQPKMVLEIGASLGIDTAYLASANSKTKVISIDEHGVVNHPPKDYFKELKLKNVERVVGNIHETLPQLLRQQGQLDFVYLNTSGKENVLNWFYQCLAKANESSLFVLSNMYDTDDMKDAWTEIKNNEQVQVTVDLFYLGLVFFRKEQVKQHFLIRF